MRLDIIVTAADGSTGRDVRSTLLSIGALRGVDLHDVRVILVSPDGGTGGLGDLGFEIVGVKRAASTAKDSGLYASNADYVVFFEPGECFYGYGLLAVAMAELAARPAILITGYVMSTDIVVSDPADLTLHGKFFRREWLVENNLWIGDMTEENFVELAELVAAKDEVRVMAQPITIHYGGGEMAEPYVVWLEQKDALIHELVRRELFGGVKFVIGNVIARTYVDFRVENSRNEMLANGAAFLTFIKRYRDVIRILDWERIQKWADYYGSSLGGCCDGSDIHEWVEKIIKS